MLAVAHPISYFQAVVLGLLQGVTELFPISSLGHSVVLPKLLGWDRLVRFQSATESPYLAFLVGLHVATALALLWYFRREWIELARALYRSIRRRRIETPQERLIWLLVVATIPAGITGLALEHAFRTLFAKPVAAAAFLMANGVILLTGERTRRRAPVPTAPTARVAVVSGASTEPGRRLDTLDFSEGVVVGVAQVLALLAGISRSGVTMVAGLVRGINHEDAARFSFLLATPIIGAAGVYKLPDLLGHQGDGIRSQVLVGSVAAAIAAYVAVRWLVRYFQTRTLTPFALYCLAIGAALTIAWGVF